MGRESRHLWVGNIPDNASETDIVDYFTQLVHTSILQFVVLSLFVTYISIYN